MTEQLLHYREEYGIDGRGLPPRPCNLPWVCALTLPMTILDFGGSSGWCYDYVRNNVPDLALEGYAVVETPEVASYMSTSGLHSAPVTYATAEEISAPFDLLYCNSVLQYFGSNAPLLSLVERCQPSHILLDDLLANSEEDTFSRQRYYETMIPHRFIGLARLRAELAERGYRLMVQVPHASPVFGVLQPLPMEALPAAHRIRYAVSLLLGRTTGS